MAMTAATMENRNRRVGFTFLAFVLAMLGLGFASVPLYRLFCQVTGFQGTTQRATQAQADTVAVSTHMISVRFDANKAPSLDRG